MPLVPSSARNQPDLRLHLFVLVAVTAVAWAPALTGAFHYDDFANIELDRATSHWDALLARLSNGFRPLLRLSYASDYALWGFTPAGFLATNFVVHLLTVLTVWQLAKYRLGGPLAALTAALVFALQPAHAAAVAWASGRSTELSTLLLCLALVAHERGTRARSGWLWPTASVMLMALAAATKEVALIFPAILLLWEATRGEQMDRRRLIWRVAPSAVATLVILGVALAASTRLREVLAFSFDYASPLASLADQLRALPISFSLWFRPWALSVEHPNPEGAALLVLGGVMAAAMFAAGIWNLRRRPLLSLALLWPLVMLLPSHSLIARCDLVVEKPLYGAWIGPSLGLGALLAVGLRASQALPLRAAMALTLALFLGLTHWRAWVWADPAALWREASEAAPQSTRTWNNRAVTALAVHNIEDARFALARLRSLDPSSPRLDDIELTLNLIARDEEVPRQ